MLRPSLALLTILSLLTLLSCRAESHHDPRVDEWRAVLALKRSAEAGDAAAKQRYADAVIRFLQTHPNHTRARVVYRDLQVERARELTSGGNYQEAAAIYEHLIRNFPRDEESQNELRRVRELQVVTRQELTLVERGMAVARVIELLGAPPAGWRREAVHNGRKFESLYYRNAEGGIAAIHAENGRVFAADYESSSANR